jgi:hypothetical protein
MAFHGSCHAGRAGRAGISGWWQNEREQGKVDEIKARIAHARVRVTFLREGDRRAASNGCGANSS